MIYRVRYAADGTRRYYIGEREVTKEEFDLALPAKPIGVPMVASPKCWPMVSEALAVHPDQVEEANARNKLHGITATYDADGFCHIPDRAERRRLCRLEGYHDRDGGYGDA